MDRIQLLQGCSVTARKQFTFYPLGSQIFLVLIWSTSERWKTKSTLELPSGFEHGTPGLEVQRLNHYAIIVFFSKTEPASFINIQDYFLNKRNWISFTNCQYLILLKN